jgi:hypothetical protein
MKKNAIWSPSDTMIARELKMLGRGIEAYRAAKAKAEAAGEPFDQPQPPQLRGETVHAEGAISVEALRLEEPQLSNRGMKLNEAKKLKKENQAKELAKVSTRNLLWERLGNLRSPVDYAITNSIGTAGRRRSGGVCSEDGCSSPRNERSLRQASEHGRQESIRQDTKQNSSQETQTRVPRP